MLIEASVREQMPKTSPRDGALQQSDSDALFEMANLFPKHTGLPFVVWISTGEGVQRDVRVKVFPGPTSLPSEMTSVALRPTIHVVHGDISAEDLDLLARWIELNKDVILRYWEGSIDTVDAMQAIQPIR